MKKEQIINSLSELEKLIRRFGTGCDDKGYMLWTPGLILANGMNVSRMLLAIIFALGEVHVIGFDDVDGQWRDLTDEDQHMAYIYLTEQGYHLCEKNNVDVPVDEGIDDLLPF